jgi:predicted GNAT family acetyltransferase
MLSSTQRNKIVDSINTMFAKIGNANGSKLPPTKDNQEPIAWELFVAQHLNALAGKRKDQAEKAAVRAEVIVDKEKSPQPEGMSTIEYTGEHVQVMLKVSNAASRVDITKVIEYLLGHGVQADIVRTAIDKATTKNRPAHVFSTVLLTED